MTYKFWIVFFILAIIIIIFDRKYGMLRDLSKANIRPYSWGRVQLAWWTLIILSAFIAIFWIKSTLPNLHYSTLVLLGISAATLTAAQAIDMSDLNTPNLKRHQDWASDNFFLDVLSDQNGVSIHRFQVVVFNAVFGIWFISQVLDGLQTCAGGACIDSIIPEISDNNLILLGLSAATYAAVKTTENKLPQITSSSSPPTNPNTTTTVSAAPPATVSS